MKIKPKIHKKFILILTLILLFVPLTAYAQISAEAGETINELLRQLQTGLNVIFQLIQTIFWPILLIIGGLLGNDLLFSSGMEDRLLDVWVEIRNFVNIGFVVILIGIAIYNVSGMVNREELMLKTILPKFVIALILVNFSFIGMKIVLDTTNVLTNAVFAMPASIEEGLQHTPVFPSLTQNNNQDLKEKLANMSADEKEKMRSLCRNIYGKDPKKFQEDLKDQNVRMNSLCTVNNNQYEFQQKGVDYFTRYGSRNAAMIMAIQMMKVVQIDEVKEQMGQKISLSTLTFNLIFSVVLYILYGAAYISLFAILLVRIVVLWIVVALSPLLALFLVFKGGAGGLGQYKEKIVDYILAPIWIGIPLTIGYLMLDAYQKARPEGRVGSFSPFTSTHNLQTSGISTLQELIIAFAAVAVVWVGVFMFAANKFRVAGFIGEKLRGFGRTAGRALSLAQVIPVGKGRKTSLAKAMGGYGALGRWVRKKEGELYGGNLPELRRVKTRKEFLKKIKPAYRSRTLGERNVQERVSEMLRRNRKLSGQLLTPAALRRFGTKKGGPEGRREVIEKLRKGEYSQAQMQRWLEDMGIAGVKGAPPTTGGAAGGTGAAGGAAAQQTSGTPQQKAKRRVKARLDDADNNLGIMNGLEPSEQKELDRLRDRGTAEQIKQSPSYKKLMDARKTDEIDNIKNKARDFNPNDAKPLADALKKYKEEIEKSDNISGDEAKKFTDAVLQKHMGSQRDYNQAKDAIKNLGGYGDILP
jgi:hypothetical protein